MKVNIYGNIKVYTRTVVAGLLLCSGMVACNDVMEDSLKYDYPSADNGNLRSGHVLVVVMDGVSGTAMMSARNAEKAPNITSMLSTALYTDFGLGDTSDPAQLDADGLTEARGWANLLIGNTAHGIKSSEDLQPDNPVDNLVSYLADEGSNVSLYVSNEAIRKAFGTKAGVSPVVTTDLAVKDAVLNELAQDETSELIVAQLRGVVEAVGDGEFYDDRNIPTTTVTNAIATLDGYVGEIWEALKSRPRFSKENWLVIVTSNYGGLYKPGEEFETYYDDFNRNTFTVMYNDRLKQQVQGSPGNQAVPYSFYTPIWAFNIRNLEPTVYAESARLGDTTLGDLKFSQDETTKVWTIEPITIQFFMRGNASSLSRSCLLSKSTYARVNGWNIALTYGNQLTTCFGSWTWQITAWNIDWTKWHVVTWMVEPNPTNKGRCTLKMFVDGQLKGTKDYNNAEFRNKYLQDESKHGELSKSPMRIGSTDRRGIQGGSGGYNPHWDWESDADGTTQFYITNVQLYNTAIPEDDVTKYLGMTKLHLQKDTYPYWKNLVGYWPCDLEQDEGAAYLKNYADPVETETGTTENTDEHAYDFHIDRGTSDIYIAGVDASSSALAPYRDPELIYGKTIRTIDIPRQIFLWLGKSVRWEWNQKGQAWQFAYREMADEQQ